MKKKAYVFVGASYRGRVMFMRPMKEKYSEYCELKGLYDINPGRAKEIGGQVGIPVFDDFEAMVHETKPDVVIVTTVDAFHSDYIIRAMELGCDVITEKPMTIDAARSNAILDAEKRTGKHVTVTFNYRYMPFATEIKKLLSENIIGDIFSIHFEWLLDRNMDVLAHGTSYFRRWNSRMDKSGGLLVHKSTHHFDLINWWIGQKPQTVTAFGNLNLYGVQGSKKYFGNISGKNCRNCAYDKICPFYYSLSDDEQKLYASNEEYDGYYKDGCVFAPDIDIYDTMATTVQYDGGTVLNYSLNATCAYEGWRITINGSKGRLEAYMPETGPDSLSDFDMIRIFGLNNDVTEHKINKVGGGGNDGGHGGGDERLRSDLFVGDCSDPLGHRAGSNAGAASIIIGAAANIAIKEKRLVNISELVKL